MARLHCAHTGNIDIEKIDYQQSAIVTRVKLKRVHNNIAYERFYHRGALAMLPLTHNECACILSAGQAEIERMSALSDDLYLQEIQKLIGFRLGHLDSISKRHTSLGNCCVRRAQVTIACCCWVMPRIRCTDCGTGFNLALYEAAVW